MMPSRIEDYALIGDCETAALVARDGSIDWLCWPRFDSPACFAALLGTPDHGHWRIAPAGHVNSIKRQYIDESLLLETSFLTDEGEATIIDFMPPRAQQEDTDVSDLVRLVTCRRGKVAMEMELILRFD
jgi:GH15 family glucan-1,4-alpha-glucosidase